MQENQDLESLNEEKHPHSDEFAARETSLQPPEERLTDDDRQLIAANQLGILLHVYRPKAGFIHLYRGLSVFSVVMVVLGLVLLLLDVSRHWSWSLVLRPDTYATFFLDEAPILMPSLLALVAVVFVHSEARNLPHDRVMIFESGFLLKQTRWRKRQADVLRWEQIEKIFDDGLLTHVYVLRRRGGKELRLDIRYQHLEVLIAEIRRQVSLYHRGSLR
jgi:hypothetical protein